MFCLSFLCECIPKCDMILIWLIVLSSMKFPVSSGETQLSAIVNQLVEKTFNGYKCLNICHAKNVYPDDRATILLNLHAANFSYRLIDSGPQRSFENCDGFILFTNEVIETIRSLVGNTVVFTRTTRILCISETEEILRLRLTKNQRSFPEDIDVLLSIVTQDDGIFFKSDRYNVDFEPVDINDPAPFFHSRTFIPQTVNYQKRKFRLATFNCSVFGNVAENELRDGIEVRIYKEIERKLNFVTDVMVPNDGHRWGEIYSNGTINGGILKYLHEGRADIGFCSLWIEKKRFRVINMSTYWNFVYMKFLVPKPKVIPTDWSNILKPLPHIMWILILSSTMITSSVCCLFRFMRARLFPDEQKATTLNTIASEFVTIVGILMLANPNKTVNNTSNEHLYLWCSVFALIITTLYSSSLVSHLTYPQFESMIQTTEGLLKAGYYWGTSYKTPMEDLFNLENEWNVRFAERFLPEVKPNDRVNRLMGGNYTILVKSVGDEHYVEVEEIPRNILHQLRATRTNVNYYLLAFAFRKNLPISSHFDRIIHRLVESGITTYWINRIFEQMYPSSTFKKVFEYKIPPEEVELIPLNMDNLQGAFAVLVVGLFCASTVFVIELVIKHKWRGVK